MPSRNTSLLASCAANDLRNKTHSWHRFALLLENSLPHD